MIPDYTGRNKRARPFNERYTAILDVDGLEGSEPWLWRLEKNERCVVPARTCLPLPASASIHRANGNMRRDGAFLRAGSWATLIRGSARTG
jgi:hypothetical protein